MGDAVQDMLSWQEGVKFLVYGAVFFVIASALFPGLTTEQARDIDETVEETTPEAPTGATPALCNNTDKLVNRITTHGRINPPSDYSNHLIIDYKGEGLANWTATKPGNGHGDFICVKGGEGTPQPDYFSCDTYRNTPLVLEHVNSTATITIDRVILDEFSGLDSVSCADG